MRRRGGGARRRTGRRTEGSGRRMERREGGMGREKGGGRGEEKGGGGWGGERGEGWEDSLLEELHNRGGSGGVQPGSWLVQIEDCGRDDQLQANVAALAFTTRNTSSELRANLPPMHTDMTILYNNLPTTLTEIYAYTTKVGNRRHMYIHA